MFDPRPPCYENTGDWFSTHTTTLYLAAQICQTCPHKEPCKTLGKDEPYGIWGGELKDPPSSSVAINYRKTCAKMKKTLVDFAELEARLAKLNRDILDE